MAKVCIFVVFVASFFITDASVDESIEIRIFNPNFNGMSSQELQILIEEADLPSLGYRKITETKTETDFETGLQVQKEAVRFLKKMRCGEVGEAEEMLHSLFPGALSDDVSAKAKTEVQNRNINNDATCITGIEFHLKTCQYGRAKRGAPGSKGEAGQTGGKKCGVCIGICIALMLPSL